MPKGVKKDDKDMGLQAEEIDLTEDTPNTDLLIEIDNLKQENEQKEKEYKELEKKYKRLQTSNQKLTQHFKKYEEKQEDEIKNVEPVQVETFFKKGFFTL